MIDLSPRLICNLIYDHLIREADEEGRVQIDDWLESPLTAGEIAEDEEWLAELNSPLIANEDELDERQRAFLQARGVIDSDGSSG